MKKSCVILDGFALTYRAYYGLPTSIRTIKGTAINAVLGFYNTLSALIEQFQPHYLIAVFDHTQPSFRQTMYPLYKANRPPMPDDLRQQLPLIKDVLTACAIPILQLASYEADDIIGTITCNLPPETEAYVITVDRDLLQLVNSQVTVVIPNNRYNRIYTPSTVQDEINVTPEQIPDLKALIGDPSDNIPGIALIGPKTASKWLKEYGSLEAIIAHADQLPGKAGANLRASIQQVRLYKQLTTICTNAPLLWCWQACKLTTDFSPLRTILDSIGIAAKLPTNLRTAQ